MSQLCFEIDTKGTCLLCLNSNNSTSENDDKVESTTAFKMLLRYLKIDVTKLIRCSFSAQSSGSGVLYNDNLQVSLCEDCSSVAVDFLELYQAFEGIRMQLDLCVRQLYNFVERGSKDSERVREYERKMNTGNIQDLICGSIAGNLRKEAMDKAFRKVGSSIPRISVQTFGKPEKHNYENSEHLSANEQARPEKDNSSQTSEEPTIMREQGEKGSPWKCGYCRQSYFREINLQTHQYNKHAMALLSDKGLLPTTISERQLETTLGNIIGQTKSTIVTCPFCSKKQAKYHLRAHLLHRHFPEIIQKAKKVSSAQPTSRKKTPWKCVPCKTYYSQKYILQRHKISKHTMTTLQQKHLLPSHISEHQLETAVSEIRGQFDGGTCPLCASRGFGGVSLKRIHLLQMHLPFVIQNAEKVPLVIKEDLHSPPVEVVTLEDEETMTHLFKCAHCEMQFPRKHTLELHQYHKHAMIILKDGIPDQVSEQDIVVASRKIAATMKVISRCGGQPVRECHLCTSSRSSSRVWGNFKVHLLKKHLDQVVRQVEESRNSASTSSQVEYMAETQAVTYAEIPYD